METNIDGAYATACLLHVTADQVVFDRLRPIGSDQAATDSGLVPHQYDQALGLGDL